MKIGIIGSGTMGSGIAHVCIQNGFFVSLVDLDQNILNKALKTIQANMHRQIRKKLLSDKEIKNALDKLSTNTNLQVLSDCEIIIEAASEKENVKYELSLVFPSI